MTTTEETRRRGTVPAVGTAVLVTGLALMVALSWRVAGRLPDPVTFTGTGSRGADQQAPRVLVLTGMPLLTLALAAALAAAQRWRRTAAAGLNVPLWRDDPTHRRAVDLGLGVLAPVLLALHLLILRAADGHAGSGMSYVAAAVALLVVTVGNLWPKQVPTVPEPIRTRLDLPARRRLDRGLEEHRRHLRPTGITMVLLGLAALACSWPVPLVSLGVSLLAIVYQAAVLLATTWRSMGTDDSDSHPSP